LSVPGLGLVATTYLFLTNETLVAGIAYDGLGNPLSAWHGVGDSAGATAVEEIPSLAFKLGRNYPNPFSGSTQIDFEMDQSGQARLRVFDIRGREVSVLLNESLPAGDHSATFNSEDLSSGVYFYELAVDGVSSAQKFMILK